MSIKAFKKFDATSVLLEGTNLIEASAGTGKTYSIAVMALRLIVEKGIPVPQILMVTFTKAAVAELQERVRLFIKQAQKVTLSKEIEQVGISELIGKAQNVYGKELVAQRINDAVLAMDELSIMTIHSFCQQTLNEFAFETDQLFGAEMFTELDKVIEQEVNEFWRKQVTTLDTRLLSVLAYPSLKTSIGDIVKEHLNGKRYAHYDAERQYNRSDFTYEAFENLEEELESEIEIGIQELVQFTVQNLEEIRKICLSSRVRSKQEFIERIDDAHVFIEYLLEVDKNKLRDNLFDFYGPKIDSLRELKDNSSQFLALRFRKNLLCFALQIICSRVEGFLLKNSFLGYNDLIKNLYKALLKPNNEALVAAMQQKYKAVFVDEFQDTDKEQFIIFQKAFYTNTILFLIGDPKQSIYAWRKADIFTYFSARNSVDNCYEMNTNFRSNEQMIDAMNQFFNPEIGFDTFAFSDRENSIQYLPVDNPAKNTKVELRFAKQREKAITIFETDNKEQITAALANEIGYLLSDANFSLHANNKSRSLKPSDIGILVTTGNEGKLVKDALISKGIPATLLQDAKLFDTAEATQVLYILEAILNPQLSSIRRALLANFFNISLAEILKLNDELVLSLFNEFKDIWSEEGVYPALVRVFKDFAVSTHLLHNKTIEGESQLAILYQFATLLHQAQYNKDWQMEELIAWLKRHISGVEIQGDEYLLPLESDEDAVKIITIHKSKGLEYNIVFAPYLDKDFLFKPSATNNNELKFFELESFRNEEGDYISKELKLMTDAEIALNKEQKEQENRRLIYVAITRAVCKSYIFKNNSKRIQNSGLSKFYSVLQKNKSYLNQIELLLLPEYKNANYISSRAVKKAILLQAANFKLLNENWYKLSYTGISSAHDFVKKDRERIAEQHSYDYFIFHELPSGAETGNFLHYIFEKIDFVDNAYWERRVEQALNNYLFANATTALPHLLQLVTEVVSLPISFQNDQLSLAEVPFYKRISELEFDFKIEHLNIPELQKLNTEQRNLNVRNFDYSTLRGVLNGKVDLFFEHNNKYYILDWKSNYLGNSIEAYNEEGVNEAMNENNYHLQYLIYTVAVTKYLTSKLKDFNYETQFGGVVYLFLRGVRKDSSTGVFAIKPKYEEVQILEKILS